MKVTIGNYASYIEVKEWDDSFKPLTTKSIANNVLLDYNKDGELVGIEILDELKPDYYEDYEEEQ
jgi:uncharacterized protein YuzE